MDKMQFEAFKANALIRTYYLDMFAKFEKEVRKNFESSLLSVEAGAKNRLFFYLGHNNLLKFNIDYNINTSTTLFKQFKKDDLFKEFQTAKIIKLDLQDSFIKEFDVKIESINKSIIEFRFHDVAIKLINMRNVLAHQQYDTSFTDKELVELVSPKKINELNKFDLDNYLFNYQDQQNQQIMSNLIYMNNVLDKIKA